MKRQLTEFPVLTGLLKQALNFSKGSGSGAAALVETLAKWFDCSWGSYWKVDLDSHLLRAAAEWMEDSARLDRMLCDTKGRTLAPGEGMPGKVWRLRRAFYSDNLVRDMCLPRSLLAQAAGLSAGIWFPVFKSSDTYGVIELLGKELWADDEQILSHLMLLGNSIAELLSEHKGP